jgi:hypothetical protein
MDDLIDCRKQSQIASQNIKFYISAKQKKLKTSSNFVQQSAPRKIPFAKYPEMFY